MLLHLDSLPFSMKEGGKMYYGYVSYSRSIDKVYVITKGHETPEAADDERAAKIEALLPRWRQFSLFSFLAW